MKRRLSLFLVLASSLLAGGPWASAQALPQPIRLDGYAASVDGRVILVSDVMFRIARAQQELAQKYKGKELEREIEKLYQQGLDFLIERELMLSAFGETKMTLPEQMVNDRITEIINTRFNKNRATFLEALAKDGMTLGEWKEDIRDEMRISILRQQEVFGKVYVSPQAVRDAYVKRKADFDRPEEFNLQMIVLKPKEGAPVEEEKAKGVVNRLRNGADFADTARSLSGGVNASEGGLMGWTPAAHLREELKGAIKAVKDGDVTDPVKIGDQWFIAKRLGYRPGGLVPYEQVQQELKRTLQREEENRIYDAWVTRLKDRYAVKRF